MAEACFPVWNDCHILYELAHSIAIVSSSHQADIFLQNAVVSEGLRHMHGVTTRLPRVAHEPIIYREWQIPANVGRTRDFLVRQALLNLVRRRPQSANRTTSSTWIRTSFHNPKNSSQSDGSKPKKKTPTSTATWYLSQKGAGNV